ncbi:MAG: phosphate signaling complex protein PhoU [Armatimonadetes bacterium]|nr:phosphate signaling complex protein PhoU [Armatimonadota bacterium]
MVTSGNGLPIRSEYREKLARLREMVLEMATFVDGMLSRGMEALQENNPELAEEVRLSDDVSDALNYGIEELAINLLALQQPMARDLREITAAIRIATDLERIGDYSKDIAKVARKLRGEPLYWPLEDIPEMARLVADMLRKAINAFVDRDVESARSLADDDEAVDIIFKRVTEQLMEHMRQDPRYVFQATQLLFVARYLERIGDHTVNVGERVVYMETGRLTPEG